MHRQHNPHDTVQKPPASYPFPTLNVSIGCSPHDVRAGLHHVVGTLSSMNLRADAIKAIELVLAETLNNIVEHAFSQTDTSAPDAIQVEGAFLCGKLHFHILDEGREMPPDCIPCKNRMPPGPDPAGLPEGGFGWLLINSLAAQVRYRRVDGQNQLDFWIPAPRR